MVNRGEWFWSLANFKGVNGVAKIYLELTFAAVQNLLFCVHIHCMNYLCNFFVSLCYSFTPLRKNNLEEIERVFSAP